MKLTIQTHTSAHHLRLVLHLSCRHLDGLLALHDWALPKLHLVQAIHIRVDHL